MRGKRIWCEDISPTLKSIRASKKHGKIVEINSNQYECIGDDMLYCLTTSRIEKQTFENSSIHPLVYINWNDKTLSYELIKINGSVNPPLNWLSEYEKVGNLIDNPEMLVGD